MSRGWNRLKSRRSRRRSSSSSSSSSSSLSPYNDQTETRMQLEADDLPKNKKEIFDVFTLARTNQILRGQTPIGDDPLHDHRSARHRDKNKKRKRTKVKVPKKAKKKKKVKKAKAEEAKVKPTGKSKEFSAKKKWIELVTAEILSSKISVIPKPGESGANVPTDPRRGRYQTQSDFGLPTSHLCKLVRLHLLTDIIKRHNLIGPKIDTNLGKGKPTKEELDAWKLSKGRRINESTYKRSKWRVISTKKKKTRFLSRFKLCQTCGDFHFKRHCGGKDVRISLMVKQINRKAEVIKEVMEEAWEKLEDLENAYRDMLSKASRLQSNRVCLGLLTGEDYPGEHHPDNCPCSKQKAEEEEERRRLEELRQEELRRLREEQEKLAVQRARRERILQLRKKRFYTKLMQAEKETDHSSQNGRVRFDQTPEDSGEDEDDDKRAREDLFKIPRLRPDDVPVDGDGLRDFDLPPMVPTDLHRFEASRWKTKLSLADNLDALAPTAIGSHSKPSLLTRLIERVHGRPMELVVMDGEVKSLEQRYYEDGAIVLEEGLSISSVSVDTSSDLDEPSEDEIMTEEEFIYDSSCQDEEVFEAENRPEDDMMPFEEFFNMEFIESVLNEQIENTLPDS